MHLLKERNSTGKLRQWRRNVLKIGGANFIIKYPAEGCQQGGGGGGGGRCGCARGGCGPSRAERGSFENVW